MPRPLLGHLFALATVCIWSFSFLFIIRINRYLDPVAVVAARKDLLLLFVAGLWVASRPRLRGLSRRDWLVVVALAFVGGPLYHLTFAWAAGKDAAGAPRIDPALLGLILATVPVHTGWLAWLTLGERLTARRAAALALGLGGVAVVLFGRYGSIELIPRGQLEGPIGATASAIVAAGIAVLMRAARGVLPPVELIAVSGLITVLMVAPLNLVGDLRPLASMHADGWLAIGFLGIMGSGVAAVTWAAAMRNIPAVTGATYLFLASVLAALWGWIFNGTPVGWPFVFGGALVLGGLLVGAAGGRKPEPDARGVHACASE